MSRIYIKIGMSYAMTEIEKPKVLSSEVEEIIPEDIKEIIGSIPDEKQREELEVYFCRTVFSGPLPPPRILDGYNDLIKNGAERIMKMAENQSAHRIKIEEFTIKRQLSQSGRGQIFGFVLAIILIVAAIYLAKTGHDTVATIIASTTIVGLCTVFVIGRKQE